MVCIDTSQLKLKNCLVLQLKIIIPMNIQEVLTNKVKQAVSAIFNVDLPVVEFQPTRKDFEGDITSVIFPMLRYVKK